MKDSCQEEATIFLQNPIFASHTFPSASEREYISVFGLPIYKREMKKCLLTLKKELSSQKKAPTLVFTPNLEMLARAKHSSETFKLLQKADLLLPDGIGTQILSGFRVRERIAGIEIGEALLALSEKEGFRVYLLGGRTGVAENAAERLTAQFPALSIVGTHHGYFDKREEQAVTAEIRAASPDLLFVCMGFPLQEEFLVRNRSSLSPVRIALGLGGSLDVWAGDLCRAPVWMQRCGLEWLFRTTKEPHRIKRIFRSIHEILLPRK